MEDLDDALAELLQVEEVLDIETDFDVDLASIDVSALRLESSPSDKPRPPTPSAAGEILKLQVLAGRGTYPARGKASGPQIVIQNNGRKKVEVKTATGTLFLPPGEVGGVVLEPGRKKAKVSARKLVRFYAWVDAWFVNPPWNGYWVRGAAWIKLGERTINVDAGGVVSDEHGNKSIDEVAGNILFGRGDAFNMTGPT